jgi:hypothetical protein
MLPKVRPFRGNLYNRRCGGTFREVVPVTDLPERVGYAVVFLRMAEKEMRELAENTPEITRELGTIADQFHAEADDLARHLAE